MPKTLYISIRGKTYQSLQEYCQKNGLAVSALINGLCDEFFKVNKPAMKTLIPESKTRNETVARLFDPSELNHL